MKYKLSFRKHLNVPERLEQRVLMFTPDGNLVHALPYSLDFSSAQTGYEDAANLGTGFTRIQSNTAGTEYQPSQLSLDRSAGVLRVTTTGSASTGSNFEADNTLNNGLGIAFDGSSQAFAITTTLVGPLSNINKSLQQAGLMFGPNQDNYIKLVAQYSNGRQSIQFTDERNQSTHTINSVNLVGPFALMASLSLRLVCDPNIGVIQASYSINGTAYVPIASSITLAGADKSAFFAAKSLASILAFNKSASSAFTVAYDSFVVDGGTQFSLSPRVTRVTPADATTLVGRDAFVAVDTYLPNGAIDAATVTDASVLLVNETDSSTVPVDLSLNGGSIVLHPQSILDANTTYSVHINGALKDVTGSPFAPITTTFTTGTSDGSAGGSIGFDQSPQASTTGQAWTSVTVGPDHNLYATTQTGAIYRFGIDANGALSSGQLIDTITTHEGANRAIGGLVFDPASTSDNLIAYVTHSSADLSNAANFTGKLTKLTGANLETAQDLVANLPRSVGSNKTNQPVFGPDGAIYIGQASNSTAGAPDLVSGQRSETLLSGAILRVDLNKLPIGNALDVRTTDAGGSYDPTATGAAVTLYAAGVRNAYDLLFANSKLYAPDIGAVAGGNTPAGTGAIALTNLSQTQSDLLVRVDSSGKYFGHPNPSQGHFVLNGGNPTAGSDPFEVTAYPQGTATDSAWRAPIFDLGQYQSPTGLTQYHGTAFNSALDGRILLTRSGGSSDIVAITLDSNGNVASLSSGITGLRGFNQPVDVVEDAQTGFLYVAELGGQQITRLRPVSAGPNADVSKSRLIYNDVAGGSASATQSVVIRNSGDADLVIPAGGIAVSGTNAARFTISSPPTLPTTLTPGDSLTISIAFNPSSGEAFGIKTAQLTVASNALNSPNINVDLRGLSTQGQGGTNEPSLQRILDLWQIPVVVGDSNPDDYALDYPQVQPNDEVVVQKLKKASAGAPVTIEPLAAFALSTSPSIRVAYYQPGSPDLRTPIFSVSQADSQSVNVTPVGSTSFDPGSGAFGILTQFPGFTNADGALRDAVSEDPLNTWDTVNTRKVRFYPLKNSDGSVVANAYVFATEDFETAYESNDFVGIIRNVTPAALGPQIGLVNLDGTPYSDRLVFNRIQNLNATTPNVVHDVSTVRIRNSGTANLVINSLNITGRWALNSTITLPATIAPGASLDVPVKFTATTGGMQTGTLAIGSNDPDQPTKNVTLAGFWQQYSENHNGVSLEPTVSNIFALFGSTTKALGPGQTEDTGGNPTPVGDEIISYYWKRADSAQKITVQSLATFHTQGNTQTIRWWPKGNTAGKTVIFTQTGPDGQSILPRSTATGNPLCKASFSTSSSFGIAMDNEWSDDVVNKEKNPTVTDGGHHIRFYPYKDRDGNVVANTYLVTGDYLAMNYDFQDAVLLISNITPDTSPAPAVVQTAVVSTAPVFANSSPIANKFDPATDSVLTQIASIIA